MNHSLFIDIAFEQAAQSRIEGGVARGAVLVKHGEVVSKAHDRTRQLNDPIAVAEMQCIRRAGRRNDQSEWILYTTGYPDMLSAGTILQFSIGSVVVALPEASTPGIDLLKSRSVPITFVESK